MMQLTPMEIRRQDFKKNFKGYNPDEVRAFLEGLAGQLESVLSEKDALAMEARELKIRLEKYEKLERTLQDMLMHSQRTVEEAKTGAERQASILVKEAEITASEIKKNAERDLEEIKRSTALLKEQKKMYLLKFRTLVKTQADLLALLESDDVAAAKTPKVNLLGGEPDSRGSAAPSA
jgi:cell division initiation protein